MVIDSTDQHVAMDQHDDQLKQANRWDRANKETIDKKMDTQPAGKLRISLNSSTEEYVENYIENYKFRHMIIVLQFE